MSFWVCMYYSGVLLIYLRDQYRINEELATWLYYEEKKLNSIFEVVAVQP